MIDQKTTLKKVDKLHPSHEAQKHRELLSWARLVFRKHRLAVLGAKQEALADLEALINKHLSSIQCVSDKNKTEALKNAVVDFVEVELELCCEMCSCFPVCHDLDGMTPQETEKYRSALAEQGWASLCGDYQHQRDLVPVLQASREFSSEYLKGESLLDMIESIEDAVSRFRKNMERVKNTKINETGSIKFRAETERRS